MDSKQECRGVQRNWDLPRCGWECITCHCFGNTVWQFLRRLETGLLVLPELKPCPCRRLEAGLVQEEFPHAAGCLGSAQSLRPLQRAAHTPGAEQRRSSQPEKPAASGQDPTQPEGNKRSSQIIPTHQVTQYTRTLLGTHPGETDTRPTRPPYGNLQSGLNHRPGGRSHPRVYQWTDR